MSTMLQTDRPMTDSPAMTKAVRVLVVEDDPGVASLLRRGLAFEGYEVAHVSDGGQALMSVRNDPPDLLILDVMLPVINGIEVAKRIRSAEAKSGSKSLPILMLTARDGVPDRISGLDAGADDYLVKPFDLDELGARIRALLRRQAGRALPLLAHGGVTLDPATRQVMRDGQPVLLSAREYAVLELLMQRPGAVLSRAQIEDRLYGWGEEIESNAVSVYVHQLRKKLGAAFIRSMRGVGYFLAADK